MGCNSTKLPLLLERAGERRMKSTTYIPLIPTFSLKGEGAHTCVDTHALRERAGEREYNTQVISCTFLGVNVGLDASSIAMILSVT